MNSILVKKELFDKNDELRKKLFDKNDELKKYLESLPSITTSHVNLLLVDKTVNKYQLFIDSSNSSTFSIVYEHYYDSQLLLDFIIKSFSQIERVAVVSYGQESLGKFLNNELFNSNNNIEFINSLSKKFGFKTIDFLACNVLKYTPWINYFNQLSEQGLVVGASNDKTGNIKYGGDWILESTGTDVKPVYWTNLIETYSELLDTVTINHIVYDLDSSNYNAIIVEWDEGINSDIIIPSTITVNGNNYTVVSIGDWAFFDCTSLTSVTIGNGVETIGVGAFSDCTSLQSVTIGDSVETIGSSAFRNCTSLTSVTIGDSVQTIGNSAFRNCVSLTSVTIGDSVQIIGGFAFRNCVSLTSVTIGNSIEIINVYVFYDCVSLTNVKIGNNNSPTSVSIGDNITEIKSFAFSRCTSITSVSIGRNVKIIGQNAFEDCISLSHIYFEADDFNSYNLNSKIFYYLNPSSRFYLSDTIANNEYLTNNPKLFGYNISIGDSSELVITTPIVSGISWSSIVALSNYYVVTTNQYMIKQGIVYLRRKSGPYVNPINYFNPTNSLNLIGQKLTYLPIFDEIERITKYNITKTAGDQINTTGWSQIQWSRGSTKEWIDDDYAQIKLTSGKHFNFNSTQYFNINISTNGFISFDNIDTSYYYNLKTHFGSKRISIFNTDLEVNTSACYYKELSDYLGIYYSCRNYDDDDESDTVTYEACVKLYFESGKIEVNYIKINPNFTSLLGLSDGSGVNYNPDDSEPTLVKYSVFNF